MLRSFTVSFEKVLKSCLLIFMALPVLIDTLCTVAGLKAPAMLVYDMATKVFGIELFPHHNIADLNSSITFIILLSQEKPLRRKKINTHTHTHTHTHECIKKFVFLLYS